MMEKIVLYRRALSKPETELHYAPAKSEQEGGTLSVSALQPSWKGLCAPQSGRDRAEQICSQQICDDGLLICLQVCAWPLLWKASYNQTSE